MAAIGSLVFCTDCGTLLEPNAGRKPYIICDVCGSQNKDTSSKTITTSSKPDAFPSTLRTKLRSDVQEVSESERRTEVKIKEPCPKCGHDEVRFYTQQLRSADEGSTVFYTCESCSFKWVVNN